VGDLSEVFYFLRGDLLVEDVLLLLLSDDVLYFSTVLATSSEMTLEALGEEGSEVGILGQTTGLIRRAHEATHRCTEPTHLGHDVSIPEPNSIGFISVRLTDAVAFVLKLVHILLCEDSLTQVDFPKSIFDESLRNSSCRIVVHLVIFITNNVDVHVFAIKARVVVLLVVVLLPSSLVTHS